MKGFDEIFWVRRGLRTNCLDFGGTWWYYLQA